MQPKTADYPIERDTRVVVETSPFCRGNEDRTPPAIIAYPGCDDWRVRFVPNLYPVLSEDRAQINIAFGLRRGIDGSGRHEV